MNSTTPLVDAAVNDTAFEDKNQPHTDWITADAGRKIEKKLNEAVEKIDDLKNKLAKWESELSSVMPPDFKDWHQNSRDEWPEVARGVIKSLREREEFAFSCLNEERNALLASRAREAQLRTALEWCSVAIERFVLPPTMHAGFCGPESGCDGICQENVAFAEGVSQIQKALTLPAPPVVPVGDVKPLVDALALDQPCSILTLLDECADALDHLFDHHGCDADGWEGWNDDRKTCRTMRGAIGNALSTFTAKHKL